MRLLLWLFGVVSAVLAKEYALIVVVGEYAHLKPLPFAQQDMKYYKQVAHNWGAKEPVILYNTQATQQAILAKLHEIADKIEKNDRFFLFFSGHGSSLYDPYYSALFQAAGLEKLLANSGALLPYDFDPTHIAQSVIIGKRDLKEPLMKIDQKVSQGLIVFDACYSEYTSRATKVQMPDPTPNILTQSGDYPYQNLIYVASSITEAQSGYFAPILYACSKEPLQLQHLRTCLNQKLGKSVQIPVVLGSVAEEK